MEATSMHLLRAIDGNIDSLQWIAVHFQPLLIAQVNLRLGGRGRPEDVEDLAEDVWVITLKKLKDLRPREGRLAPVLVSFLGSSVIHCCNNFLRRKIRRAALAPEVHKDEDDKDLALDCFAAETRGVVTRVSSNELSKLIERCLQALSDDKREVLVLRLMEQRSNQEIAEMLHIPANTVAVRYRRALEALRSGLPRQAFEQIFAASAKISDDS